VFLVDTNVISEARKGAKANIGVRAFWKSATLEEIYICVQTIGEIRRGIELVRGRGDSAQAGRLASWLDSIVEQYAGRVLQFDIDSAQVWGKLMARDPQHPIDKQIAAIALMHGLTVFTRNTVDFRGTGAALHNPFN